PRALHSFPTRRSSDLGITALGCLRFGPVSVGDRPPGVCPITAAHFFGCDRRHGKQGLGGSGCPRPTTATAYWPFCPQSCRARPLDRKSTRLNSSHVSI